MATLSSLPLAAPFIAPLAPVSLLPAAAGALPPLPFALQAGDAAARNGTAAPPLDLHENAAMRPDQVFMARQLVWPVFDGAGLASAWRTMARVYGAQLAALQHHARGQQVPGNLLMTGLHQGMPQGLPLQPAGLLWHPDAWRFVLPGAGGQQLALRLLTGLPDPPPGRRRRAKAALRLELVLADGSHATVQLELVDGVMMELAAEHPHAVAQLRQALPALKLAVEHTGLRVSRAGTRQGLLPCQPLQQYSAQVNALLPPQLFRAMAEVALLLAAASAGNAAVGYGLSRV